MPPRRSLSDTVPWRGSSDQRFRVPGVLTGRSGALFEARPDRPIRTDQRPRVEPSSEPADRGEDQVGRRDKLRGSARGNRPYENNPPTKIWGTLSEFQSGSTPSTQPSADHTIT